VAVEAHHGPEFAARLSEAVAAGVNWNWFLKTAYAHGVHPLAARNVLACEGNHLPPKVEGILRRWLQHTLARNLHLVRGLEEILADFEAAGICVVCLKGPALAASVFGGLEVRASNDLDLIVPREQVERASEVLQAAGFSKAFGNLTSEELRFFRPRFGLPFTFLRSWDRLQVELHWAFERYESPPDLAFWKRSQQVTVEGVSLPIMPPKDVVLFAARHAAVHGWNVLRHLCDFREAGRHLAPADWEAVASAARRTRQTAALAVTALLVRDYFGSAVPESIRMFSARGWRVPWLARRASRHLLENLRVGTARAASPTIAWVLQPGLTAFWHRLELAIRPCVLEREWVRLPRPLWPLYYLLRPVRLILKYGRSGRRT